MTRRDRLRRTMRAVVSDAVSDLLYYDRKEDEDLDRDDVAEMFEKGWITPDEILSWFGEELKAAASALPSGGDGE